MYYGWNNIYLISRFKQEKVLKDFWNTTKQEEEYLRSRSSGSDMDCRSSLHSIHWFFCVFFRIRLVHISFISWEIYLDCKNLLNKHQGVHILYEYESVHLLHLNVFQHNIRRDHHDWSMRQKIYWHVLCQIAPRSFDLKRHMQ